MGQWGESMFESDGVLDFLAEFKDSIDFSLIEQAIEVVLESDDYIDVDDCYSVIAAAEIIAAIKGKKHEDFPLEFSFDTILFNDFINSDLLKSIIKAVKKALKSEDSELVGLWEDSDMLTVYYRDIKIRIAVEL